MTVVVARAPWSQDAVRSLSEEDRAALYAAIPEGWTLSIVAKTHGRGQRMGLRLMEPGGNRERPTLRREWVHWSDIPAAAKAMVAEARRFCVHEWGDPPETCARCGQLWEDT